MRRGIRANSFPRVSTPAKTDYADLASVWTTITAIRTKISISQRIALIGVWAFFEGTSSSGQLLDDAESKMEELIFALIA
jgi:hypothetical protein